MADQAAVETALVSLVASILFPATPYLSGDYAASAAQAAWPPATSASPTPATAPIVVRLYRGWPLPANLDADLALGRAHVTIFPESGVVRNTSRFLPQSVQTTSPVHTLAWSVVGNVATLSGTITTPQNIALIIDGVGFAYAVQALDTLSTAAAGITALVAAQRTATAVGPVVTIPGAHAVVGRVGGYGTMTTVVRQQTQGFRVMIWAPTPAARDALSGLIDAGIAGLMTPSGNLTEFLTLADGTLAHVTFRTTYTDDKPQEMRLWRRDLCYTLEYLTTVSTTSPEMIVPTDSYQEGFIDLSLFISNSPPKVTVSF